MNSFFNELEKYKTARVEKSRKTDSFVYNYFQWTRWDWRVDINVETTSVPLKDFRKKIF